MPQYPAQISVMHVLKMNEDTPLMETGRESRITIVPSKIPEDPERAKEVFLAFAHQAAEELWEREVKEAWCPTTS